MKRVEVISRSGLQTYERIGCATSADITGDTTRVVGYAGVLLK